MQHLRHLIESRPQMTRIPDQSLLATPNGDREEYRIACRSQDGSYALIYSPRYRAVDVDMRVLNGQQFVAHWYDPRTGLSTRIGLVQGNKTQTFAPPFKPDAPLNTDWVLVLDNVRRKFPVPGQPLP